MVECLVPKISTLSSQAIRQGATATALDNGWITEVAGHYSGKKATHLAVRRGVGIDLDTGFVLYDTGVDSFTLRPLGDATVRYRVRPGWVELLEVAGLPLPPRFDTMPMWYEVETKNGHSRIVRVRPDSADVVVFPETSEPGDGFSAVLMVIAGELNGIETALTFKRHGFEVHYRVETSPEAGEGRSFSMADLCRANAWDQGDLLVDLRPSRQYYSAVVIAEINDLHVYGVNHHGTRFFLMPDRHWRKITPSVKEETTDASTA